MAIGLFFSSQGLGDDPELLRPAIENENASLIILNALDPYPNARQNALPCEMAELAALGYHCQELDLRNYFQHTSENHLHHQAKTEDLTALLTNANLIWVAGGNTFVLARAMAQSQFKTALIQASVQAHHTITYAGYSAGAAVAGPDLQGIHLMDDPNIIPEFYDPASQPTSLHLIDQRIIPHFQSNSEESAHADLAVTYLRERSLSYRSMSDGEVWITHA